tara:strand:- start:320 stop:598 length:279 start_codon:yes stop_codon:yes gene_type:complete
METKEEEVVAKKEETDQLILKLHPDSVECSQCGLYMWENTYADIQYCKICMSESLQGIIDHLGEDEDPIPAGVGDTKVDFMLNLTATYVREQ